MKNTNVDQNCLGRKGLTISHFESIKSRVLGIDYEIKFTHAVAGTRSTNNVSEALFKMHLVESEHLGKVLRQI
jgi:hypothetical protein